MRRLNNLVSFHQGECAVPSAAKKVSFHISHTRCPVFGVMSMTEVMRGVKAMASLFMPSKKITPFSGIKDSTFWGSWALGSYHSSIP